MTLRPLASNILFVFLDRESKTNGVAHLTKQTKSGIIIHGINNEEQSNTPRWAKVVAVGPDCLDVKNGDYILIDALRWTMGMEFEGHKIWKTAEKEVILIADEAPELEY